MCALSAEASPARRSASCPLGGASARLSAGPSAAPGHSARCSSLPWPAGAADFNVLDGGDELSGRAGASARRRVGASLTL